MRSWPSHASRKATDAGSCPRTSPPAPPSPAPYLSKILNGLVKSGLISGKRGYRGGFKLSRPPATISLLEVVEAAEGRAWEPRCLLGGDDPTVTVDAAYSKNGEARVVPLPDETGGMLRDWRAERAVEPADAPVFRMPSEYKVAKMMRKDLEAARKRWIDEAKTIEERSKGEASDFLAYVDHEGR